jgi:aspartate kinase
MIVMKFGGTSVEDGAAIDRSCGIVIQRAQMHPLVVVSALGGATNELLGAGRLAANAELDKALEIADKLERRHVELLSSTGKYFTQLRELLRALGSIGEFSPRTQDLVAAYGETLSSLIFADRLQRLGQNVVHLDSRRIIVTDETFGRATPLLQPTAERLARFARPPIEKGQIVVMGGYISGTLSGVTTTLGRGGSDYTAAIVGAAIAAEEIQIWTDVDGMMTADPRIVPNSYKVKDISFAEASELAYFGAKVLHPLTLIPAIEKNIPVFILNSRRPAGSGTRITREARPTSNAIKSIAVKRGITAVTVSSSRMLMAHGFLRALFDVFDQHGTAVDVVATSEVSVSLTLDNTWALPAILEDLKPLGDVTVMDQVALICIVGNNLKYTAGIAHRAFASVKDINVLMISHGASNINLSFIVAQQDADAAVRQLHADFFKEADREVFEPSDSDFSNRQNPVQATKGE